MGQKFLVINAFLPLGVYRFFMSKCPWIGVVYQTHVLSYKYLVQELEHVKDTQANYFLSENPWVSGWGLTGSR